MQKLDDNVKKVLGSLDILIKEKMYALEHGLPTAHFEISINALMGVLKMLEGK